MEEGSNLQRSSRTRNQPDKIHGAVLVQIGPSKCVPEDAGYTKCLPEELKMWSSKFGPEKRGTPSVSTEWYTQNVCA